MLLSLNVGMMYYTALEMPNSHLSLNLGKNIHMWMKFMYYDVNL